MAPAHIETMRVDSIQMVHDHREQAREQARTLAKSFTQAYLHQPSEGLTTHYSPERDHL